MTALQRPAPAVWWSFPENAVARPLPQREIGRDGVEAFLVKRVQLLGGQSIKLAPMQAGIPDRLVMLPGGKIFLVEVKAVGGTLEPIQRHWHQKIARDQGITVHVVEGEEGVRRWLRAVFNDGTAGRPDRASRKNAANARAVRPRSTAASRRKTA